MSTNRVERKLIRRLDYKQYPYEAPIINLDIFVHNGKCTITNTLTLRPKYHGVFQDIVLDGQKNVCGLEPVSLSINNMVIPLESVEITKEKMTIPKTLLEKVGDEFKIAVTSTSEYIKNTSMSGIYNTDGIICSQMEAEGFRSNIYHIDRPDILSIYTVKVTCNEKDYPIILSNGDKQSESRDEKEGTITVVYHDPWPKPCYLFALVAGKLESQSGEFITCSGKKVQINAWCREGRGYKEKLSHAVECVIAAMRFDERVFRREYDLNTFNIVSVDNFNMGAMENKSLNIFNSKYILASKQSSTDTDYLNIANVIGHEYFHNWSGNRVTCRDWFQLTLKEGLTIFRDQEFTATLTSPVCKRIDDYNVLKNHQFNEDASSLAHPIRPESYFAIDNFYTVTVYEKGSEVIRMMQTIVGKNAFHKGLDLYYERHDGHAVTCDDFVEAIEDAYISSDTEISFNTTSNTDNIKSLVDKNIKPLEQFRRWYEQAGTPFVKFDYEYTPEKRQLIIHMEQSIPNFPHNAPAAGNGPIRILDIPLLVAFVDFESGLPISVRILEKESLEANNNIDKDEFGVDFYWNSLTRKKLNTLFSEDSKNPVILLRHCQKRQTFVLEINTENNGFDGFCQKVPNRLIPSINCNFSAPITVNCEQITLKDSLFLTAHDPDMLNRWENGQTGAMIVLFKILDLIKNQSMYPLLNHKDMEDKELLSTPISKKIIDQISNIPEYVLFVNAIKLLLQNTIKAIDNGNQDDVFADYLARQLSFPPAARILNERQKEREHPGKCYLARQLLDIKLAEDCKDQLIQLHQRAQHMGANFSKLIEDDNLDQNSFGSQTYQKAVAWRSLGCTLLKLMYNGSNQFDRNIKEIVFNALDSAVTMTDELAATVTLAQSFDSSVSSKALEKFQSRWKNDILAMVKYYIIVSTLLIPGENPIVVRERVKKLVNDDRFDRLNSNMVYSLVGGFISNLGAFYYSKDQLEDNMEFVASFLFDLDKSNSTLASRLMTRFSNRHSIDENLSDTVKNILEKHLKINKESISSELQEIVDNVLSD